MAAKRDYYEILGVARESPSGDIKKAYRRLAMKYHPDRNASDQVAEEKFKEVQEAWDVLSDEKKRSAYDRFGHSGVEAAAEGFQRDANISDVFESVFGDIFSGGGARGGRGQPGGSRRGSDLRCELELDLKDAVFGTTSTLQIPKLIRCHTCGGTGAAKGSQPVLCRRCDGHGQIRMQQGFFSVQQTCPQCRGQGRKITDPCGSCRGQGRIQDTKTLSVKIPAGVDNGDRIRMSGEGGAGEQQAPGGDLYVDIKVKPHPIFKRDGQSLYCDVPISFRDAALGGTQEIPTLNGPVNLGIPAETQSGRVLRLRGKGVPSLRGKGCGDLLCRVAVETPVNLNNEQKDLLQRFDESIRDHPRNSPQSRSWLNRVKSFLDNAVKH